MPESKTPSSPLNRGGGELNDCRLTMKPLRVGAGSFSCKSLIAEVYAGFRYDSLMAGKVVTMGRGGRG